jgi:hypothetical protein
MAQPTYSVTADFTYIEGALKSRWEPFHRLASEFTAFRPKTRGDYAEARLKELARLQGLNPEAPDDELLALIDGQIDAALIPGRQQATRFTDPIMAEYVTVAFLSHALCEAMINAVLAIGLAMEGAAEVFPLLERADIKEKWLCGPKAISPAYTLDKSSAIFQTLQHLTRQRNALIHYKVELEIGGEVMIQGSKLHRAPLKDDIEWIRRFFSLPFDLMDHVRRQLDHGMFLLLPSSDPIERYLPHLH